MTGEQLELLKAAISLGLAGLMIYLGYRLFDRWAGKFLEAQMEQGKAMQRLAAAVEGGQGEQHDLVLALRVVASQQTELKDWIRELDEHVRNGGGRQA